MKILIAGVDGYLGWPLAQHLLARGHEVAGIDLFLRRQWVEEVGGHSAIPIFPMEERLIALFERTGIRMPFWHGDLREFEVIERALSSFAPDAIVHMGECPSAPYSMIDASHAAFVQTNNIVSTLNLLYGIHALVPKCHLVKIGTMGEYGTPNVDIPEGMFELEFRGRRELLPFPRQAGSWYHWSKVHGSNNIMFACKVWGLQATDIMQGVVFGTRVPEMGSDPRLGTRFDFDQCFGTVINRYCACAVAGLPLTPYGSGRQKRGFLPLADSMQCLTIALENPPTPGEYRVFNQFEEVYDVTDLAFKVHHAGTTLGLDINVRNLQNPRKEHEEHYYNPDHKKLLALGYIPTRDIDGEIRGMLNDLLPHKERILQKAEATVPDIRWDGSRKRSEFLPL